jgi:Sec-independent protein translocase protein TatA
VTVETTVGKDGKVIRRYEVVVRPAHEAMAREEMRSYLGKGWKPCVRKESEDKPEIFAVREFRDARDLPYVQAQVQGPEACGWHGLKQRYVYEETMSLEAILSTKQERQVAENLSVTYKLTMPGVITQSSLERSEGGKPEATKEALNKGAANTISWTFKVAQIEGLKVHAESERLNYGRLFALVFAAVVVLAVAAYVLRPLWRWIGKKIKERAAIPPEERERRRREREERKQQQAQERAAADAARAAQSAEKKRLKAEKRQQKKAAPSEGEK